MLPLHAMKPLQTFWRSGEPVFPFRESNHNSSIQSIDYAQYRLRGGLHSNQLLCVCACVRTVLYRCVMYVLKDVVTLCPTGGVDRRTLRHTRSITTPVCLLTKVRVSAFARGGR